MESAFQLAAATRLEPAAVDLAHQEFRHLAQVLRLQKGQGLARLLPVDPASLPQAGEVEDSVEALVAEPEERHGQAAQRLPAGRGEQPHLRLRELGELLLEEVGRRHLEEAGQYPVGIDPPTGRARRQCSLRRA